VENYIGEVVEGRTYVKSELTKMGYSVHGNTGNYLLIDLKAADNAKNFVGYLREKHIYVKGPWQGQWDKYVTITLGPKRLMHRFMDAVKEWNGKQI
jgi:histidinol-phosphate/aromatic aminotransferase/cobyric acid decarboxylase-like protein